MAMNFRERLAWLGRMPLHYRALFGTQFIITAFAMRYRYKLVERRRLKLEAEETGIDTASKTS